MLKIRQPSYTSCGGRSTHRMTAVILIVRRPSSYNQTTLKRDANKYKKYAIYNKEIIKYEIKQVCLKCFIIIYKCSYIFIIELFNPTL